MGNCLVLAPADIRERAKRSKEVDAFLKSHGKLTREEIKLLLLGSLRTLFSIAFCLRF